MDYELRKDKRNGMNILKLTSEKGIEEIVSNAYPVQAYFTRVVDDKLCTECENILGFKIHKNWNGVVESINGL